jgi:hypothetical protein
VPIPQEPTQPLVNEDALPPKLRVYGVYDPIEELQFVGILCNVKAAPGYDACCKSTFQMFQMF